MKKGDYVRNQYGIAKVIDIENNYGLDILVFDKNICFAVDYRTGERNEDIPLFNKLPLTENISLNKVKSSPNIIDLIEIGDYVNGWRVNRVEKEEDGTLLTIGTITSFVSRNETEPYLTQDYNEADKMCKLKSILTKEQFESMEYKL